MPIVFYIMRRDDLLVLDGSESSVCRNEEGLGQRLGSENYRIDTFVHTVLDTEKK